MRHWMQRTLPAALTALATVGACVDSTPTDVTPPMRPSLQLSTVKVFTAQDLGTLGLGDVFDEGTAINGNGQIVGISSTASGRHAFLWTPATGMRDIGSLGGLGGDTYAWDINDGGQVVGEGFTTGSTGFAEVHAFLWTAAAGMKDLGTLGGTFSAAFGINNKGQIVGETEMALPHDGHVFLWTATTGMTDLGKQAGASESLARAINEQGEIAGWSVVPSGERGIFWSAATGIVDVGSFGGGITQALDINNQGQVVGVSQNASGLYRAFVWTLVGGMTDLGTLPGNDQSLAFGINNTGHIVGATSTSGKGGGHAFFWSTTDGMIDLGGSYCGAVAEDVNDQDQVVGWLGVPTITTSCEFRAVLWTPSTALRVAIDIKPGSFPNSINVGSGGTVPVAIFGADGFDVTTVDPLSVTLAGAQVQLRGRGTPMTSLTDVNGDGRLDLVVHVSTDALQLSDGDVQAVLDGTTSAGARFRGFDSVRIVP